MRTSFWTDSRLGKYVRYTTTPYYTIGEEKKKKIFITCALKYNGDTVSLGFGPTVERAQQDAISNIPKGKRFLLENETKESGAASGIVA